MDHVGSAVVIPQHHHNMVGGEQQGPRCGGFDVGQLLCMGHALEAFPREGLSLFVSVPGQLDPHGLVHILDEGGAVHTVVHAAPAIGGPQMLEGHFNGTVGGVGQVPLMEIGPVGGFHRDNLEIALMVPGG